MSQRSSREGRTELANSAFEDEIYHYSKELKDGRDRVEVTNQIFECPYCQVYEKKEYYAFEELLKHAFCIGVESKGASFRDKAKHLGLLRYLEESYLDKKANSSQSSLSDELQMKDKQCEELMFEAFNKELQTREQRQRDHIESLCTEHERSMLELEAKREQLKLCEKGASNESEKRKLDLQKEMNEKAIEEQKKADESMLKLLEIQKAEMLKLRQQSMEMLKKLDHRQQLELEIEQMKGVVVVMNHITGNADAGKEEDGSLLKKI